MNAKTLRHTGKGLVNGLARNGFAGSAALDIFIMEGKSTFEPGQRLHRVCQQSTFFGQGINIVLAFTAWLDQSAIAKFCQVVAHGGLALAAKFVANVPDIMLGIGQQQQDLQTRWVGNLLQQVRCTPHPNHCKGRFR